MRGSGFRVLRSPIYFICLSIVCLSMHKIHLNIQLVYAYIYTHMHEAKDAAGICIYFIQSSVCAVTNLSNRCMISLDAYSFRLFTPTPEILRTPMQQSQ